MTIRLLHALLLGAALPAAAQTSPDRRPSGVAVATDVVVLDRANAIVDEGALEVAIRKAADSTVLTPRAREMGRAMIADSFPLSATGIIEDTLGLGGVPALGFDGYGNKVGVEQDGTRNAVSVDQRTGWAGWAVANQLGEDNRVVVEQTDAALPGNYSRNRVYVGQVSLASESGSEDYRQTAVIRQVHRVVLSDVKPNYAAVQQGGIRGREVGNEDVARRAIGENNVAQVEQNGASNDALIQQGAEDARFFAVEYGDSVGRNNRGLVVQVGLGNRAVVSQEDDSDAMTRQIGSDNLAFVHQDADNDAAAQFSEIEQGRLEDEGSGNFAALLQRGLGQQSRIRQYGSGDTAVVEQSSTALHARSEITQRGGTDNFTSVLQDNPGAFVTDGVTSTVLQTGSSNNSWTVQRTDGSFSATYQTGARNAAQVRQ